jgi:hypothetical protein
MSINFKSTDNQMSYLKSNSGATTGIASSNVLSSNNIWSGSNQFSTVYLKDQPVYFRSVGDAGHSIYWDSVLDGIAVSGWRGVSLRCTQSGKNCVTVKDDTISFLSKTALNSNAIYLKSLADSNHQIVMDLVTDSLSIYSFQGVSLGASIANKKALVIGPQQIDSNIPMNILGNVALNTKSLFLKSFGDTNHQITYEGSIDGVSIFGNLGVQLGTVQYGKRSLYVGNVAEMNVPCTFSSSPICAAIPTSSNHLVSKAYVDSVMQKQKFGVYRGTSDREQTIFFPTPFPSGTIPIIQLTVVYSGVGSAPLGVIYLVDYANTYLTYGYMLNNVHAESSVAINWLAMIP